VGNEQRRNVGAAAKGGGFRSMNESVDGAEHLEFF